MGTIDNSQGANWCHLCGCTDQPMHGRSHVIPAWLFRQIASEGGGGLVRFNFPSVKRFSDHSMTPVLVDPERETPFDFNWYCIQCETRFGDCDDYAAKFLKSPSGLKKPRARQELIPATEHRPAILMVTHRSAWMLLKWVLSLTYRMHQSNHDSYGDISIGDVNAERIRKILLSNAFSADIHRHDIQIVVTARTEAEDIHAFATPTWSSEGEDGGFSLVFGAWGIWFAVGYPNGSFAHSKHIPRHNTNAVYMPLISAQTSMDWFHVLFTGA